MHSSCPDNTGPGNTPGPQWSHHRSHTRSRPRNPLTLALMMGLYNCILVMVCQESDNLFLRNVTRTTSPHHQELLND